MSKKYFIIEEPRRSIDDVQFSNIISVEDSSYDEIEQSREQVKNRGGALRGPYGSEQEARADQESWRLDNFKDYAQVIEAALARGTRRPFLVKLANKAGSDLLVYPGYYGVLQKSLESLQRLFDVHLITGKDNLDDLKKVFQIICVRDLEPLNQNGLDHIWAFKYHPLVDRDPYESCKKIFHYRLNWEKICGRALRMVVVQKNPAIQPSVETLDELKRFAELTGFKQSLVDDLMHSYSERIDGIPDDKMIPYGPKPNNPILKTPSGESAEIELY